jgi:hypothetical protein
MSMVRGRSSSRNAKRGRARTVSRSLSVRNSNRQDGRTFRGWALPAAMSQVFDPFPAKMRSILRYADTISLDATTGIPLHYFFRATSIYDPDATGVGHQPYGHDTLATVYNHYTVMKATIKITTASQGSNNILGLTMTADPVGQLGYTTSMEVKPTKCIPLGSSQDPVSLSMTYERNKTFGGTKPAELTAAYNANPVENVFFDIFTQGNLAGNNPSALAILVTIIYEVESVELRDLGGS